MRIRTIALALPLAAVAACSTSNTEGSRTARTDRQGAAASGGAQASGDGAHATGNATTADQGTAQVVTGKITHVSPQAVTITADDGDHTLSLDPRTAILVDGQTADATALSEGLPARAAFSTVNGQDVALRIYAVRNTGPALDPGTGGTGGEHGSDSPSNPYREGRPPGQR